MIDNNREELMEQYEDAAFALLMSDYAEQEGARLLQEFENLQPEMPAALDVRCSDLIHRTYEKQRRKDRMKRTLQTLTRTVTVLLLIIGVCSALIFSVEAIRVPLINFFFEYQDGFMGISGDGDSDREAFAPSSLESFMPEGYVCCRSTSYDKDHTEIYQNAEGSTIVFSFHSLDGEINIDIEDATVEEIILAGYSGQLVKNGTSQKLIWYDEEHLLVYIVTASDLNTSTLWKLAEQIAQLYANP